jgi:general secretion pathway protein K
MSRLRQYPGRKSQRGMALVIVLWLVAVMAVIASGHSRNAHNEMRLAMNQIETAQARSVAQAAFSLTVLDMLSTANSDELPRPGTPFARRLNDRDVIITIRPTAALLDLNSASESLLRALIIAAGTTDDIAASIAAAIVDWRDGDSFAHLNGAEDDEYAIAGREWSARDDNFVSVDELRYVLGMTETLYRKIAPCVTVHSDQRTIDLESAPELLLRAVTGAETATTGASGSANGAGTYVIDITVQGKSGTAVTVEAVVRLTASAQQPFNILQWRDAPRWWPIAEDDKRV